MQQIADGMAIQQGVANVTPLVAQRLSKLLAAACQIKW
jgi:hypothetical protein